MALEKTTKQNLRLLRLKVEEAAHRKMRTPSDFCLLSEKMHKRIGETLSVSTLKRIWGYVGGYNSPRLTTLNLLCRYLGYADWEDFETNYCNNPDAENNELLLKDCLFSEDLTPGDLINVAWNPNCHCQFKYLGNWYFIVECCEHTKLQLGEQFRCPFFILHQPLYIDHLTSQDKKAKSKICILAPKGGLTLLEKNK